MNPVLAMSGCSPDEFGDISFTMPSYQVSLNTNASKAASPAETPAETPAASAAETPCFVVSGDNENHVLAHFLGYLLNEVARGRQTWETIAHRFAPSGDGLNVTYMMFCERMEPFSDEEMEEEGVPDYKNNEVWGVWLTTPYPETVRGATASEEVSGDVLRDLIAQTRTLCRAGASRGTDGLDFCIARYEERRTLPPRRIIRDAQTPLGFRVENDPDQVLQDLIYFFLDAIRENKETWNGLRKRLAPSGDGFRVPETFSVFRINDAADSLYSSRGYYEPPLPDYAAFEAWMVSRLYPAARVELSGEDLRGLMEQAESLYPKLHP